MFANLKNIEGSPNGGVKQAPPFIHSWKSAWELLIKLFRGTREVLAKLHVLKMLGTIQILAKEIYRPYCIALGKKRMFPECMVQYLYLRNSL